MCSFKSPFETAHVQFMLSLPSFTMDSLILIYQDGTWEQILQTPFRVPHYALRNDPMLFDAFLDVRSGEQTIVYDVIEDTGREFIVSLDNQSKTWVKWT